MRLPCRDDVVLIYAFRPSHPVQRVHTVFIDTSFGPVRCFTCADAVETSSATFTTLGPETRPSLCLLSQIRIAVLDDSTCCCL